MHPKLIGVIALIGAGLMFGCSLAFRIFSTPPGPQIEVQTTSQGVVVISFSELPQSDEARAMEIEVKSILDDQPVIFEYEFQNKSVLYIVHPNKDSCFQLLVTATSWKETSIGSLRITSEPKAAEVNLQICDPNLPPEKREVIPLPTPIPTPTAPPPATPEVGTTGYPAPVSP